MSSDCDLMLGLLLWYCWWTQWMLSWETSDLLSSKSLQEDKQRKDKQNKYKKVRIRRSKKVKGKRRKVKEESKDQLFWREFRRIGSFSRLAVAVLEEVLFWGIAAALNPTSFISFPHKVCLEVPSKLRRRVAAEFGPLAPKKFGRQILAASIKLPPGSQESKDSMIPMGSERWCRPWNCPCETLWSTGPGSKATRRGD